MLSTTFRSLQDTVLLLVVLFAIHAQYCKVAACSIEYGLIGESSDTLEVLAFEYAVCWDFFDDATLGGTDAEGEVMVDSLEDLEEDYSLEFADRIISACGTVDDASAPETVGLLVSPSDVYLRNEDNCHFYRGEFGIYTTSALTDENKSFLIQALDTASSKVTPHPENSLLVLDDSKMQLTEDTFTDAEGSIDTTHLTATPAPSKAPSEPSTSPTSAPVPPTLAPSSQPVEGGTPDPSPAPTPMPTAITPAPSAAAEVSLNLSTTQLLWARMENARFVTPYFYYGGWLGILAGIILLCACCVLSGPTRPKSTI